MVNHYVEFLNYIILDKMDNQYFVQYFSRLKTNQVMVSLKRENAVTRRSIKKKKRKKSA